MLRRIFKLIKYKYDSIVTHYQFKTYRRRADRLHKLTGRRYHVIPNNAGGMVVVDNRYIDIYNKAMKSSKGKPITIADLLKMSYYSTSLNGVVRKPD